MLFTEVLILLAATVAATFGFISVFRPLACRIGLVDQPGGRKDHKKPTALIGGAAVFIVFLLGVLMLDMPLGSWRSLFFAGTIVFIIGILDDFREIPPSSRFIAQVLASLIIVFWGNVELQTLGALLGGDPVLLGMLAVPITVLGSVGVINAANMLDGLDGLAGGLLLIFFSVLLFLAWRAGLQNEVNVLLLICGALAGFLLFNFRFTDGRPATVFMGDAGSLFLGLMVAWFLIRYTQEPYNLIRPISAVWLFGLPIMDTVAIMIRRIMRGRSPFAPDREHFHHILLAAGFKVRTAVLIILGISVLLSAVGMLGEWAGVAESVMFYSFMLLFVVYFWGMQHAWKVMKALRRVHDYTLGIQEQAEGNINV